MKKLAIFIAALFIFSAGAFAQELPRIAVYVTGDVRDNEKKALGTRMLASLVNSGRYKGIERSNSFLAEIEKEQVKQRSGEIDDNQISTLGKQFGVKFVCIADLTPAFGEYQVSARIVNVETAEVDFIGESASPLKSMTDLAIVSDKVVENMFSKKTTTVQTVQTVKPSPQDASRVVIEMVLLGGGTFQMVGRKVTLNSFYIGKYEVTQKQWVMVMGSNPSLKYKGDNLPVDNVSLNDAQEFVLKLNTVTGRKYRLPTEEEQKYATFHGKKNGVSIRSNGLGFRLVLDL